MNRFLKDLSDLYDQSEEIKEKCDEKAQKYLEHAKKFQKAEYYTLSITCYNRAAAFSKTNDLEATCYAYRATVYLKLLHFEECFKNLELAREKCTSMLLLIDIKALENVCIKHKSKINNYAPEDLMGYFKLSYPPNKKIPWIVDCVEMRWTREFGRGIYASKDLKGGDIISVEDIVVGNVQEDDYYMRCFNCFKANYLNLIPCDKTASLMFCSNKCKEELYAKAFDIKNIKRTDMRLLAEFPDAAMIENFVKKPGLNKKKKKTIFDYDFSNKNDPQYKENLMTCLLSLNVNHDLDEGFYQSRNYLSQKAVHHLMSIYKLNSKPGIVNCFFAHPFTPYSVFQNCFSHISLFASLMNHSNEENADIITVDNKVVTIITKPVKKGDQIFLNYDPHLSPSGFLPCPWISHNPTDILHYIFLRFRQFKAYKDFLTEKYWTSPMENQLYSFFYYSITMFASFCIFPVDRIIPKIFGRM